MAIPVIFIQGGGPGARAADAALYASLVQHLGESFAVDYPEMPDEDNPDYGRWAPVIAAAIASATVPPVLVGHSNGGYLLLKLLTTERPLASFPALCLIAAPFPDGDPDWSFEGFDLPDDFGARLPADAAVFLYASRDDEVVPFAHRDLYAAEIPGATTRTTAGGHQLGENLKVVADDIRAAIAE